MRRLWIGYHQHDNNAIFQIKQLYKDGRAKYEDCWAKVEDRIIQTEQQLLTNQRYCETIDPIIIQLTDSDSDTTIDYSPDDNISETTLDIDNDNNDETDDICINLTQASSSTDILNITSITEE